MLPLSSSASFLFCPREGRAGVPCHPCCPVPFSGRVLAPAPAPALAHLYNLPTPLHPPPLDPRSISSCKYSFLDTGSTNPASQTAPGINCAGGLVASAPWVAPTSPTYGLNCTDPADEVGPPQIHTTIGAYSDGLALVPSDSCTPNWADFYGRGGLATNNPAARVTITPTNASAPILLRSLYVDLLGTGVAADQPFTFRLAASSVQAVEVFVSAQIADDGYGAVDFPTPLLIPAGGNATVELIDAVPKYPQVRPAPPVARALLPARRAQPSARRRRCAWLAAQLAKLQRCGVGPRRPTSPHHARLALTRASRSLSCRCRCSPGHRLTSPSSSSSCCASARRLLAFPAAAGGADVNILQPTSGGTTRPKSCNQQYNFIFFFFHISEGPASA